MGERVANHRAGRLAGAGRGNRHQMAVARVGQKLAGDRSDLPGMEACPDALGRLAAKYEAGRQAGDVRRLCGRACALL